MRIVIPGGTGQIGRLLTRHFYERGDEVIVLSRDALTEPWQTVVWNARDLDIWADELEGADVLINMTGRNVDCRYTPAHRRGIKESRVQSTEILGEAIARCRRPPRLWLNASTATIYRHSLDREMDEIDGELGGNEPGAPFTWRFSIDVAKSWERAFFSAHTPNTRKVALRSAMTMTPSSGGVFSVLLRLVRMGLGGAAGSGMQYVSWIHETDFVRAVDFLISHHELDGAVNIASPHPLPNIEFMRELRETWGADFGIDLNEWMIEIGAYILRTESELILKSRRVVPRRLLEAGFEFTFPEWPEAARSLLVAKRHHGL
jgi:uncharacterized protein (TIGR01777 family)